MWYKDYINEGCLTCPHCNEEISGEVAEEIFDGEIITCPFCDAEILESDLKKEMRDLDEDV